MGAKRASGAAAPAGKPKKQATTLALGSSASGAQEPSQVNKDDVNAKYLNEVHADLRLVLEHPVFEGIAQLAPLTTDAVDKSMRATKPPINAKAAVLNPCGKHQQNQTIYQAID